MIITIWFHRISIPQPKHIPPPPKLSPPETLSFSMSVSQHLFCKEVQSVLFSIPHVSESIWCWCLIVWLTSLSMIVSRSIHVAKNSAASSSSFSSSSSSFLLLFLLPCETDLRKNWYDLCQRMFCLCSLLGVLWCYVLYLSP